MPETARGLRSRHRLQVGVACQLEIKWLEPLGGVQEQRRSVAAAVPSESDPSTDQVHARAAEFVERPALHRAQQE